MSHESAARSLITRIRSAGFDLKMASHEATCHAVIHALDHGRVHLFNEIFDALGKASDRQLFVRWCREFTPASWDKDIAQFSLNKAKRKALQKAGATYEALVNKDPWHSWGKDAADIDREYDIISRLRAAVKGYNNAKEEGRKTRNDWAVGRIAALLSSIEAEHIAVDHS